jgi:hypothetical protein
MVETHENYASISIHVTRGKLEVYITPSPDCNEIFCYDPKCLLNVLNPNIQVLLSAAGTPGR